MRQEKDKIKSKFDALGFSSFDSIPDNVTSLIRNFEETSNLILPDEYKYFLENYGECNFENDAIYEPVMLTPSMDPDNFQDISFFYGVGTDNDLSRMLKVYIQRIPQDYVPIAELPGGDQLCMDVGINSSNYGKVYLWDHENECNGGIENTYLVANSFSDFIDSFKEGNSKTEDDSIVSSRFDF